MYNYHRISEIQQDLFYCDSVRMVTGEQRLLQSMIVTAIKDLINNTIKHGKQIKIEQDKEFLSDICDLLPHCGFVNWKRVKGYIDLILSMTEKDILNKININNIKGINCDS